MTIPRTLGGEPLFRASAPLRETCSPYAREMSRSGRGDPREFSRSAGRSSLGRRRYRGHCGRRNMRRALRAGRVKVVRRPSISPSLRFRPIRPVSKGISERDDRQPQACSQTASSSHPDRRTGPFSYRRPVQSLRTGTGPAVKTAPDNDTMPASADKIRSRRRPTWVRLAAATSVARRTRRERNDPDRRTYPADRAGCD